MCRHGGSTVYQLVASDGTVALTGWGPIGDPLAPIRHTAEGKPYAEAVEAGTLRLQDVIGRGINRLDAARLTNALAPRKWTGKRRVGLYWRGGTRYYDSHAAAAAALGMDRTDLAWHIHRLPAADIFHVRPNRVGCATP